tara:strand:- start:174 stop:764 length:591 start_codon:yes stop_codon:yes gene_type:complete
MDANTLISIASASRYLTATDCGDGLPLTIVRVTVESLKGDRGERERGVVWFEEEERGLVLNVTLSVMLREMFGVELDAWEGKRVTLHNDKSVTRGNQRVGGIRIKGSPDIAEDLTVEAGGNAYRKHTRYLIRSERGQDPLRLALGRVDLSVDDFDRWASIESRPPFDQMDRDSRALAATWISKRGADVVRRVLGEQ